VLELSGQEDSDEDLEDTPLHGNDGNDTEDSVRSGPSFEVPKEFKEGNHTDDSSKVSDRGHRSTKLIGIRVELFVS
jgi:hypothetical protein